VAALIAVVALVVWLAWGGRESAGAAAVPVAARDANGPDLPSFAVEPVSPAADTGAAPLVAVVPEGGALTTSGASRLVVRVTWASDGSPAADITLTLFAADQPDPQHHLVKGQTDAHGTWTVEPAPLGTVGVYSDRDGAVVGKVEAGRSTELALVLPTGTLVQGRVIDAQDRPAPGAEIWLSDVSNSTQGSIVGHADDAGRFSLRGVAGNHWIGALAAGSTPSPVVEIPDVAPPEMDVVLRLGGAGGGVRGIVVDARGAPIAGAFVQVGPGYGWFGPADATGRPSYGPRAFRLHTAADGTFAAADVPAGVVPVEVIALGWTPWNTSIDVAVGEAQDLRIQLEPGATVQGVVRDAAGAAVERAMIAVGTHPTEPGYVMLTSDASGHYVLRDPPKGQQVFAASKRGVGEVRITLEIEPGQSLAWDPVLGAGLQILGRVRDEAGAPVEGLQVRCTAGPHFTGSIKSAKVAADGHFAVLNCEEGEHRLSVADATGGPVLAAVDGVRPGPDEVLISIPATARLFATVVARVVDFRGGAPLGLQAILAQPGEPIGVTGHVDAETGDILFNKVSAGDQQLNVLVQGRAPLKQDVPALKPGERRDLGTIVLPDPGRVILQVTLPAGAVAGDVMAILDPAEGHGAVPLELQEASPPVWISPPVAPGEYVLSLGSTSGGEDHVFIVPVAATVRVAAGTDARVDFVADRGVAQNITLSTPRLDPPKTWLLVTDAAGGAVVDEQVVWDEVEPGKDKRESYTSFIAKPGKYTLVIESDGQPVVQQALTLSGAVNIAPDVSLVVP